MRLCFVVLLIVGTLLASANALSTTITDADQNENSTMTFTERPLSSRLEQSDKTEKRFLRRNPTEFEEKDSDEERATKWEAVKEAAKKLKVQVNLQKWFIEGKPPKYVRGELKIPASGPEMENHIYYQLLKDYIKRYNGYKYHRFTSERL